MAATGQKVIKVGDTYQIEGRPRENVEVLKVYNPPNIPGKSLLVLSIDMDPDAATPSHTHGGATALAIVVDGTVLNKMNCDEPIVSKKGDFWYEAPGCHHVRSENVSGSEKAKFLAILIVDDEVIKDGFHNILVLDAEREEIKA